MNKIIGLLLLLLSGLVGAAQPLTLEGQTVQGGMMIGHTLPGSRVTQDDVPVMVSGDGIFLVGFGRDAAPLSIVAVTLPDGQHIQRRLQVAKRDYKIQRIDGLPPRKVTPKPEDLAHIRADIAATKKARALRDQRTDFLTGFQWPAVARISGVYGSQRILNGKPKRPHYGVDLALPTGTPVQAPADGIVTLAHPDMFYSGATLIMDHGEGLSSSFLHLHRILVKEGQRVKQGQVVAEVGKSGRATGPHLDWRMNLRDKRIDPALLAGPMPPLPH